jgi:hypothetical protein
MSTAASLHGAETATLGDDRIHLPAAPERAIASATFRSSGLIQPRREWPLERPCGPLSQARGPW